MVRKYLKENGVRLAPAPPGLDIAIENLYKVFAGYRFNPGMSGCPCCTSEGEKNKLQGKPLRKLEGEALGHYAFKAMTTWGTEDDFKHFLPRIYELLAYGGLGTDTNVVLQKIASAGWTGWPEKEQQAVRDYMHAWWFSCWENIFEGRGQRSSLEDLASEIDVFYLAMWRMDVRSPLFRHFVDELCKFLGIFEDRVKSRDLGEEDTEALENFFWRYRGLVETAADHYKTLQDEAMTAKLTVILKIYEFDKDV